MNSTDLRHLLTEFADRADTADLDQNADHRVQGALNRARTIQRRRHAITGAVAVAGTAVVVALVTAIIPALVSPDRDVPPASTPPSPPQVMPDHWDRDQRLLARADLELPDRVLYLTVRPTSPLRMTVATACPEYGNGPPHTSPQVEISINGSVFATGACGTGSSGDHAYWESLGVVPSAPTTIRLAVTSDHDVGTVGIGVYEPGARSAPGAGVGLLGEVASDPADPNQPRELVLDLEGDDISLELEPDGSTGIIRVQVNGVEVRRIDFLDYADGYAMLLATEYERRTGEPLPPEEVRVRLVPETMNGGWRAHALDCVASYDGSVTCPIPR